MTLNINIKFKALKALNGGGGALDFFNGEGGELDFFNGGELDSLDGSIDKLDYFNNQLINNLSDSYNLIAKVTTNQSLKGLDILRYLSISFDFNVYQDAINYRNANEKLTTTEFIEFKKAVKALEEYIQKISKTITIFLELKCMEKICKENKNNNQPATYKEDTNMYTEDTKKYEGYKDPYLFFPKVSTCVLTSKENKTCNENYFQDHFQEVYSNINFKDNIDQKVTQFMLDISKKKQAAVTAIKNQQKEIKNEQKDQKIEKQKDSRFLADLIQQYAGILQIALYLVGTGIAFIAAMIQNHKIRQDQKKEFMLKVVAVSGLGVIAMMLTIKLLFFR